MANSNEEWVDVQKSTFTRWANTYLSRKRMSIDDLYEDLKDGIRLIALLQIICREKVAKKYTKKPRMRIQKMENLNMAFAFLQNKGVNLTNIGSSDIIDGNNKLVLGLVWTLIKAFQVAEVDVEGVSGKDGLLLWCKRAVADYPNVDVNNFSNSWSDGLAFCALIHHFYPALIEYEQLSPANAESNVKLAFDVAQSKFKIPQLLNVSDVAGKAKPDEKSIMTYVSMLHKEFASGVQKKKAMTTLSKAVNIAQRHQDMSAQYNSLATGLLEWMTQQKERFQTLSQPRAIPHIKQALAEHIEYKRNDKPPREAEFVAMEGCAGRWEASCKNNDRAPPHFKPPLEQMLKLKDELEELETQYEVKLRQNLERFQKTDMFLTNVLKELEKLEAWSREKDATLLDVTDESTPKTTSAAEEALENVSFVRQVEVPRYKQLFAYVTEQAEGLSEEHSETSSTLERVKSMEAFLSSVDDRLDAAKERLESAVAQQKELDAIAKDCKVLLRSIKYAMVEVEEEVEAATNVQVTSSEEVVAGKQHFDEVLVPKVQESIVRDNENLLEKKVALEQGGRLDDAALIDKTNDRVEQLMELLNTKRDYFEQELANVERRDAKCREFADLAVKLRDRCEESKQAINKVEGSLGQQYTSMVKLRKRLFRSNSAVNLSILREVAKEEELAEAEEELNDANADVVVDEDAEEVESDESGDEKDGAEEKKDVLEATLATLTKEMDNLEQVNEDLEALKVYTNPFTTDTIQALRAQYESLNTAVREKVKSLEKEVALSHLGDLTSAQTREIKEVFEHFDLDKDGMLARDEFIMACRGLGFSLNEDECHDKFDEIDNEEKDEISFEQFSNFCAEQLQSGSSEGDVRTAIDVLSKDDMKVSELEEHLEPAIAEFILANKDKIVAEDGETIDETKFTQLIFSQ